MLDGHGFKKWVLPLINCVTSVNLVDVVNLSKPAFIQSKSQSFPGTRAALRKNQDNVCKAIVSCTQEVL